MHNEVSTASPPRDQVHAVPDADLRDRVAELDALVTFLQTDFEEKSSVVARKLHDEIGGAVIGAMMDVAWIEQHDSELTSDTCMRLGRVKDGLRGAIDLARMMVEELRPTLLDSVGLFAALSWQFRRGCANAGIGYQEAYPEAAPEMEANRLIALFRIAQEAFNVALQQESVSGVSLSVETTGGHLMVQLADDRRQPLAAGRDVLSNPLSAIFHRVKQLNGQAAVMSPATGGSVFRVTIPLNRD
ncbi:MAG: sensor histidine kinase [Steroidobacteraceae bacterium]